MARQFDQGSADDIGAYTKTAGEGARAAVREGAIETSYSDHPGAAAGCTAPGWPMLQPIGENLLQIRCIWRAA